MKKKRLTIFAVLAEIMLVVFCAFIIIPILWMLSTTLRNPLDAFKLPPAIIPTVFDFSAYKTVFTKVDFTLFGWNSIKVAFTVTFGQLLICSLAAYPFARIDFKGKNIMFILLLSSMMIPAQVVSIPQFIFMSKLKLVNTHFALILPGLFSVMSIFLIRQNMMSIPKSFDEAAYIDGAGRFRAYWSIILPMAKPSIMVAGVLTFIGSWNNFYGPLIFINSAKLMTLPLGLTQLRGMLNSGNQSVVIAGVLLSMLAPVIFYMFGQRYLIEGVTLGGIKG